MVTAFTFTLIRVYVGNRAIFLFRVIAIKREYRIEVYNILRGTVQTWPPCNYVFEARDGAIIPAIVAVRNINSNKTGFILAQ
jgi:hypothetical protein